MTVFRLNEVRLLLTLPQALVLCPGVNIGTQPVLSLDQARAILRGAEARALKGASGIIDNGGDDLIDGMHELRRAIAAAEKQARHAAAEECRSVATESQ